MTKDFGNLGAFAEHLILREIATLEALHVGLDGVAVAIEKTAKNAIGIYQEEAGPFPSWKLLADSTEADKARLGYPADAPLLREGNLRDSIKHETRVLEAVIGSESEIAAYQEFGTDKIPPRPFIGPAAFNNKETIKNMLGAATVVGIAGGTLLPAAYSAAIK